MADLFVLLVLCLVFVWARSFLRVVRERKNELKFRRDSLWFDEEAGLYRWTSIHGVESSSDKHPDKPGGVWFEAVYEGIERLRT